MAFEPDVLDAIKARVGLAEVIGRKTRLIRHGREFLALCPFHNEKTPSFRIYEDHYHCFGCGAHGSVFDFVMQAEQLTFPQAVEQLAELAGVTLPRRQDDGERLERDRRKRSLLEVLEQATQYYERMLRLPDGKPALDYLRRRGVDDEAIARFRLGFAPDARGALKAHLAREGATPEQMLEAGLLVQPDDRERAPYDRFRGRVMFPIADRRGRVVGFGGRVIADGQPKYLNSPETALFHKGELLYGLSLAADHARKTGRLIVVEGYMDVIGLGAAGWPETVASLGTAVTETQIEALWRVTPVPILCFDPDAAGDRAVRKTCSKILPLLHIDKSSNIEWTLRFAFLRTDTREDPDTIVRRYSKQFVHRAINDAAELHELILWLETKGQFPLSADDYSSLESRLRKHTLEIRDPSLRSRILSRMRAKMRDRSRQKTPRSQRRRERKESPLAVSFSEISNFEVRSRRGLIEQTMLAILFFHPWIFEYIEENIGSIFFRDLDLDKIRQGMVGLLGGSKVIDENMFRGELAAIGLYAPMLAIVDQAIFRNHTFLHGDVTRSEVRELWEECYSAFLADDVTSITLPDAATDEDLTRRAALRADFLRQSEL